MTTRAAAEPTLRDARVAIVLSNEGCDVTSRFVIDTADPQVVDHRLMLGDRDTRPTFVVVGAVVHQDDTVGRTARLLISLTGSGRNEYTVRYRVGLADARVDRCPLLVPATPTDGLTRSVTIVVDVPRGAMKLPGESCRTFRRANARGGVITRSVDVAETWRGTPRTIGSTWQTSMCFALIFRST